jgi:hypothetical protein
LRLEWPVHGGSRSGTDAPAAGYASSARRAASGRDGALPRDRRPLACSSVGDVDRDLHVGALTVVSIAVAGLVPLLFWPFSKTIWASVDYLVYRTSPDYASREAADHSAGNGGRP